MLNAYDYTLVYKPGKSISHADGLSRLPLLVEDYQVPAPREILLLEALDRPPLRAEDIAKMTSKDPILSRVLNWVWKGWPTERLTEEFTPFVRRQHELSAHKGCLL